MKACCLRPRWDLFIAKVFCSSLKLAIRYNLSSLILCFIAAENDIGAPKMRNNFCISEIRTFYTVFLIQNNLCEIITRGQDDMVLNVRFKDFWYTKINQTQIW